MKLISPLFVVLAALGLGLMSTTIALWFGLNQPWMGLTLNDTPGHGILVKAVNAAGPATGQIQPGDRLLEIRKANEPDTAGLNLTPQDLLEEPDTLPGPEDLSGFLKRQGEIHELLSINRVYLKVRPSGIDSSSTLVLLSPEANRPLASLPPVFWVQIGVGLVGMVLVGWVLALRRHEPAVQFFSLAGLGLMVSAHSAAIYSARELALPEAQFAQFSYLNFAGTALFGIGMINLFLIYPMRILGPWSQSVTCVSLGSCVLAVYLDGPEILQDRQAIIGLAMLALAIVILVQVVRNRNNPTARAMLGWFGLAVLLGAGGFGLTITLPALLGGTPQISQGYAFLFFLVIFAGLAMGIARYRLFDLSEWSFRILYYVAGVVLLLILDAALIFIMSLDRVPALGISLAIVGLVYLPFRDAIGQRLRHEKHLSREDLFALVTKVTLASQPQSRTEALNILLQQLFDPLRIDQYPPRDGPARLVDGGEALEIPMPHGMAERRLYWARKGRRLFSREDRQLAISLNQMLDRAISKQKEYDQAVEIERSRINRDMHDNIGVQLLGALHSNNHERKDHFIRQALADLRQIIAKPTTDASELARLLADLRAELSEHLEAAGISLTWEDNGLNVANGSLIELEPFQAQTVQAILRESVSNILRHSGGDEAYITVSSSPPHCATLTDQSMPVALLIRIEDNGRIPPSEWKGMGNGLFNLRQRIEACGGTMLLTTEQDRVSMQIELPILSTSFKADAPHAGRTAC